MYYWQAEKALEGGDLGPGPGRAFLSLSEHQFLISAGALTYYYKWMIESPFYQMSTLTDEDFHEIRDVKDTTYPDTRVCESNRWQPLGKEGFDESLMPEWAKAAFPQEKEEQTMKKKWESGPIPGDAIFQKDKEGVTWYTLIHDKSNRTHYMEFEGHVLSGCWSQPLAVFRALVSLTPQERTIDCPYEAYLVMISHRIRVLREELS